MAVADSNANEMLAHYAEEAISMLQGALEERIAAAQRAMGEVEKIKKMDPSYVSGEVRRTLKWAEPSGIGGIGGIEPTLDSLAFWYGVKKAQDEAQDERNARQQDKLGC
jgi:hypothetical protein